MTDIIELGRTIIELVFIAIEIIIIFWFIRIVKRAARCGKHGKH